MEEKNIKELKETKEMLRTIESNTEQKEINVSLEGFHFIDRSTNYDTTLKFPKLYQ